jgi:hypothetical protein
VADSHLVPGYRPISPEHRADHIEALVLLGRLVIRLPRVLSVRRGFVVMSIA